jgi:3-dehydroquinate synthase
MREITVAVPGGSYPILIGGGLLREVGVRLAAAGCRGSLALVADAGVATLYAPAVAASLKEAGFTSTLIEIPAGEQSKSLECLGGLYARFAAAGLDRRAAVVALGGGVVGDLAGFAAATYLRGIDFVQVPTTLLAQVDASVGGKTAIDIPAGKNLVGAFHQPRLVLVDLQTLETLPEPDFRSGLAEVIKYGVIADPVLFALLEARRQEILARSEGLLAEIVSRSCEIKAEVVGADEREAGLREILNYGHTLGHAVEAVAGYGRYLHGEAVAIGMAAAASLGVRLGLLPAETAARIEALIASFGLPERLREPLDPDALLAAMHRDKKARAGSLRFVLARTLGAVIVTEVPDELARAAAVAVQPRPPTE